jgi:signal transduction histidine kinase
MWPRRWSIRGWLGGLVAAVALPLLLLLTWIFVSQLQRELGEARDIALRIARTTAARIGTQHDGSVALLEQMAMRPAIRDFDGARCDSLFAIVDPFPQWPDLLFYDRHGALVCSAGPQGEDSALSREAQQAITAEVGRGGFRQGRPTIRLIRGRWVSIVSRSVAGSDGSPRGMLVLLQLLDFDSTETLLPNTVLTILDRDGTVLARSSGRSSGLANIIGRKAGDTEVAQIALRQQEGRAEARGLDGVSRQYGFTRLPRLGWTIYAGVPTADVMGQVRHTTLLGVIGGLAIVLMLTFVVILLSRGIERPVGALVKAAEEAARAGYGRTEATGGPLEIARLSAAFNEMVERRSAAELNLKALSERLLTVQEQERMRIARELHDDLGQALTALKMDVIGLLEKSRHSPDAAPMVERILRTIDSTVTAVQRISSELRPSVLDDLGLFAAIESESQLFEQRTGIECELSLPSETPAVDNASSVALYRIVQEAMTNVARHSNATRVEIRVRKRGSELFLEIRDDGRGIAPELVTNPSSLGLAGIRERADMLGGAALIEGVPGRGTIVSIRLPLEGEA